MKRILFILTLLSGIFVSCKQTDKKTVKYVGLKVYDPVYIAKDKGFFDGIDVEIIDTVAGGATAAQMVASGSVDCGLLSNMAIANAVGNGLPIIAVADIQSAFKNAPLEEFFVRSDGEISSINDLKGKKIAINLVKSSFHYTWLIAFEKVGIKESDVQFVSIPFAQQQEALEKGVVDAIGLMQPYTKSARESSDLKPLFNAVDIFGERQFCEIIMNKIWGEANPDIAKKFIEGLVKASEWVKTHQNEAKSIISKYTGVDTIYIDNYYFQSNCKVSMEDAKYWLDYMQENFNVPKWVEVKDVATNKYNVLVKE